MENGLTVGELIEKLRAFDHSMQVWFEADGGMAPVKSIRPATLAAVESVALISDFTG